MSKERIIRPGDKNYPPISNNLSIWLEKKAGMCGEGFFLPSRQFTCSKYHISWGKIPTPVEVCLFCSKMRWEKEEERRRLMNNSQAGWKLAAIFCQMEKEGCELGGEDLIPPEKRSLSSLQSKADKYF